MESRCGLQLQITQRQNMVTLQFGTICPKHGTSMQTTQNFSARATIAMDLYQIPMDRVLQLEMREGYF